VVLFPRLSTLYVAHRAPVLFVRHRFGTIFFFFLALSRCFFFRRSGFLAWQRWNGWPKGFPFLVLSLPGFMRRKFPPVRVPILFLLHSVSDFFLAPFEGRGNLTRSDLVSFFRFAVIFFLLYWWLRFHFVLSTTPGLAGKIRSGILGQNCLRWVSLFFFFDPF